MRTISFNFDGALPKHLNDLEGNILVQIYDGRHDKQLTKTLIDLLNTTLDKPLIVGKSCDKAISNGVVTNELACTITSFDKTNLRHIKVSKEGFKNSLYELLTKTTKGFLILSNTKLDFDQIAEDLKIFKAYHFFGSFGSQDDYLIYDSKFLDDALIIIAFDGDLEIHTNNILNFVGYGEYDHVTKVDGKRIYEINHKPVFNYFKDIFDIEEDKVEEVLYKFPLITSKDEYNPLRITKVYEDGSVEVIRSLREEEHIRLALPNFDLFEEDLIKAFEELSTVNVESIFSFSCLRPDDFINNLNYDCLEKISNDVVSINGETAETCLSKFFDVPSLFTGGVTLVSMAEYEGKVKINYVPLKNQNKDNFEYHLCVKLLTSLARKYDNLVNCVNNLTNNIEHEYKIDEKEMDEELDLPNYRRLVKDLLSHEQEYNISVCRFTNEYLLRDFYGDKFIDECRVELAKQAKNEYGDNLKIYSINQGFATISSGSEKEHIKMMSEIYKKMFKYGYSFKGELIDFGFVYTTVYKGTKNALIKAKRALYEILESGYVTKDYRDTFSSAFELKEGIDHYSLVQNAYKNHGFKVYYQGIYSVKQRRINHFEALIRIEDNRTGKVYSPGAFIETAYKFGYSRYITMMVMEQAFEEVSKHSCAISLNLRLTDIEDNDVYYLLLELLDKYNCQNKVMLEILEDINIIKNPLSLERLRDLREMGIKIAIDDFGAGYSNFDYLKPDLFDYLKISGDLTKNLSYDNEVMIEMVKSVVLTSHRLGMKVVVEYCEDEETADLLTELGADYIQGFYFSKPSESIELE